MDVEATTLRDHPQLQWGRDRSIAEIQRGGEKAHVAVALQWGRDRSIAELRSQLQRQTPLRGFNGAAIDRSRKSQTRRQGSRSPSASMGPRSIDRGNGAFVHDETAALSLQWGRDRSI